MENSVKIFDCFIFNDELDLLELRLELCYEYVDYFILVEAEQSFTRRPSSYHFEKNKSRYSAFLDKIIHIKVNDFSNDDPWLNEYHQRNSIKEGLVNAKDEDLIFISDVDEIFNYSDILKSNALKFIKKVTHIMHFNNFYYYLNCYQKNMTNHSIAGPYSLLKNCNIGDRGKYRISLKPKYLKHEHGVLWGWHMSYMFGIDLDKYIEKIKNFSHQEYNNKYYLNKKRIAACILIGVDFFERPDFYAMKYIKLDKRFPKRLSKIFHKSNKRYNLILKTNFYYILIITMKKIKYSPKTLPIKRFVKNILRNKI